MKNETNENAIGVLNDLVKINNDRIEGYNKAAENVEQSEVMLKTLFYQLAEESQEYKRELIDCISRLGGDASAFDTTASGKIYRVWMDVKATFSGDDNLSTLEACEFGEDAAQRAYKQAIDDSKDFSTETQELIKDQKNMLRMSHDLIKSRRDEYKQDVAHKN